LKDVTEVKSSVKSYFGMFCQDIATKQGCDVRAKTGTDLEWNLSETRAEMLFLIASC
jgi:hypothetical protein